MNHDLRLRKLKQKSEFRKLEDERRRRKLEEEQVNHSNNNDNSTLQSIPQQAELEEASSVWKAKPPKDEATIVPVESAMPRAFPLPRATTTTPSKPSATLDAAAAAPPYHSYNTITSNNKMPLQDVGLRHFQASPASSVSMSQSPWKKHVAATTEAKSRATSSLLGAGNASIQSKRGCDSNHDDNGSSEEEEEDVLGIALQKLRQKNSEACTASVAVALDTDGVVPTEQQQPSQRSSLDPNKNIRARKEIDDNDIRNENVSGSKTNASDSCQSEAYSNLTNNKATIASVPHQQEPTAAAVEPKKGPRNPLVLMREQIAADLRNTRLPPKPWDDQKHELWSTDDSDKDDDDDKMARSPVSPSSSRGRLRRKEKNGRACHDEQLDDTDGKKRRRQSQVREKEISNGQLTIETVALVDELTLRGMKKPVFENFTFTPNDALFVVCDGNGGTPEYVVPPSIAIYLPDYQREGIEFMYRKAFVPMRGAILGHGTTRTFLICVSVLPLSIHSHT